MKLKIPPVIIVALCALLMWSLDKYILPEYAIYFSGQRVVSKGLFVACMVTVLLALNIFRKQKTTADPINPSKASSLVSSGIFGVSRNPMYLSMLLLLIGWAVKLGNPFSILILVFFVWYMTEFQIKPEEKALAEIFGEEYEEYCQKVRRWV